MYTPSYAQMADQDAQWAFIEAHNFGILISSDAGEVAATHLPFILHGPQQRLYSHMAKANGQWKNLSGQRVLVVFHGPHAYISPTLYDEVGEVPTWNYMAVHVSGVLTIIDDEREVEALLTELVRQHEPSSSLLGHLGEPDYRNLQKAIVAFRIDIEQVEGKAKLNQNKSLTSQKNVAAHLSASRDPQARALGERMRAGLADDQ